ncbi:MAG TPA: prolipoprotein diacylglyceryl transferase [bacterium]
MHPVIFTLFGIPFYTYGLTTALGFGIALAYILLEAKQKQIKSEIILDMAFWLIIASIAGARILFIIVEWDYYKTRPLNILKIWEGGLVFYGGIIAAATTAMLYLKFKKQPVLTVADILAPALLLGETIGRWGCFFAGCCYGKPTSLTWGIEMPNLVGKPWVIKGLLGVTLHPTQIYSSVAALLIFIVIQLLKKKKHFEGYLTLWTFILYSLSRFIIEFFRGDERGWIIENYLSTSQFISALVFGVCLTILLLVNKKNKSTSKK